MFRYLFFSEINSERDFETTFKMVVLLLHLNPRSISTVFISTVIILAIILDTYKYRYTCKHSLQFIFSITVGP